eukprot:64699-Amphidinium_carterae.1
MMSFVALRFDMLSGTVIIINAVAIGYEAALRSKDRGMPDWLPYVEQAFLSIYIVEFVLRTLSAYTIPVEPQLSIIHRVPASFALLDLVKLQYSLKALHGKQLAQPCNNLSHLPACRQKELLTDLKS